MSRSCVGKGVLAQSIAQQAMPRIGAIVLARHVNETADAASSIAGIAQSHNARHSRCSAHGSARISHEILYVLILIMRDVRIPTDDGDLKNPAWIFGTPSTALVFPHSNTRARRTVP